jgi:protocatechuate 3,4-dioxygenase beta subunit
MSDHDLHDRGLAFDLETIFDRRHALKLFAGAGLATLIGCGSDETTTSSSTPTATATATASADCETISGETAGPYPGDGSNGPNVLTESGIVRDDIRSSFGDSSGTAEGVPLTVELTVVDTGSDCAPLEGAAVYVWHCDRAGGYSLYSEGITDQNYLRGVQEAGADGKVTFTAIFPAAYMGRWPHIHFEVYASVDDATGGGEPTVTTQLALPEDVCSAVYATEGYEQSVQNLAQTSLEGDMVFSDGADAQLAAVEGDVDSGYTATLTVAV